MPKYYCDYCDTYLTHDSPSVRKTHCQGRKHKDNVKYYYQKWMEEQAQHLIDATTAAFKAGKIASNPFAGKPGAAVPPPASLQHPGPPGPHGPPRPPGVPPPGHPGGPPGMMHPAMHPGMGPMGPMMGPQGHMMRPPMGPMGPMMGPMGPMMGPMGPMMGPMGPRGPPLIAPMPPPAMKKA
ncbi:U1 small nuclear ribonucleoprotein C [Frankliniella fusca]|uniref:U1 small nuclear ribonucleoprotein C n=1 Tax=Frankliniella fusca TaxID=407009 RepID=A0AAE1LBW1_9NEOP|nr:U1 small nuclear ribonucleoprotein C [Frankliniella fusca]